MSPMLPRGLPALLLLLLAPAAVEATAGDATTETWCSPRLGETRRAGGCVHRIRDALPQKDARRLHAYVADAWRAGRFLYATNCERQRRCRCGNAKRRFAAKEAAKEKAVAASCRASFPFTYSKWELARRDATALVLEAAIRRAVKPRLEAIVGPLANLTDWFASAFSDGDWLGNHTDGGLGDVAFILNLSPDPAFRGGDLVFADGLRAAPAFNTLSAFRVGRGAHPLRHRVAEVTYSRRGPGELAAPRFAVTGWWTAVGGDPRSVSQGVLEQERAAPRRAR